MCWIFDKCLGHALTLQFAKFFGYMTPVAIVASAMNLVSSHHRGKCKIEELATKLMKTLVFVNYVDLLREPMR